ncbi:MAG: SurA N-terminal domain-containing protein [Zetaproteobacteria bacterium]|nr:SurA N-terminal domain-containing protein [Zetaproteobacteria bacterium]
MLESMRKHAKSWVAKVMLIGIALSFALWGVGDYFLGDHVEYVAEVDGKPISDGEFQTAYQRQVNSYRNMLGKNFSKEIIDQLGLKDATLQTLINRKLMLEEANRLGLSAPEDALLLRVQSNPAFQSADGFDPERYRILTRNMGFLSTRDYENDLRLNMIIDALQQSIMAGTTTSDAEVRQRFASNFEQRILSAIIVQTESLKKEITIDDAAARAYYDEHPDRYQSMLQINMHAVEIDPDALALNISVNDADILAAFEERKAEFSEPEQRHARHILAKFNGDSDADRIQARDRIETAKARLNQGESFSDIAKALSDDTATAANGGDLGFSPKGAMIPAFDEAIFAMEAGQVSEIVETQFGYHLILLEEIKPAKEATLAAVYDTLGQTLRNEKAREEAYQLSQDLDNALGMEGSLEKAAASVDLAVQNIGPVDFNSALGNAILNHKDVRSKAFATQVGSNVDVMELDDGRFVAFEVIERIEPHLLDFSTVASKVYEDAKHDAAEKKAASLAEEILTASATQAIDQLAQNFGQPKYISKALRSNGEGDRAEWITGDVLAQAFALPPQAWLKQSIRTNQGWAVIEVSGVIAADETRFANEEAKIRQEVDQSKGAVRFARWMASVRDRHEITLHNRILERF